MLIHLELAPNVRFTATSASIGITDREVLAMRQHQVSKERVNFIWAVVQNASAQLMSIPMQGSC